ncbi:hypothetical protein GCK72_022801 [Caenorhabditis remanei]|uniref:Homeobox domain-containing protein n=1 Tax=Caenorhabditis remanei TaxID=31234 RepID=A0A6A5FUP4_CAERE|nr:hypothetical protein GCK72_022801 [Caenorhabditis remanei]KAF1746348.1 hypothetical protein GCK72_022801 [Caenorhabditis remanei]
MFYKTQFVSSNSTSKKNTAPSTNRSANVGIPQPEQLVNDKTPGSIGNTKRTSQVHVPQLASRQPLKPKNDLARLSQTQRSLAHKISTKTKRKNSQVLVSDKELYLSLDNIVGPQKKRQKTNMPELEQQKFQSSKIIADWNIRRKQLVVQPPINQPLFMDNIQTSEAVLQLITQPENSLSTNQKSEPECVEVETNFPVSSKPLRDEISTNDTALDILWQNSERQYIQLFTESQLNILNERFKKDDIIEENEKVELGRKFGVESEEIGNWFMVQKWKKTKDLTMKKKSREIVSIYENKEVIQPIQEGREMSFKKPLPTDSFDVLLLENGRNDFSCFLNTTLNMLYSCQDLRNSINKDRLEASEPDILLKNVFRKTVKTVAKLRLALPVGLHEGPNDVHRAFEELLKILNVDFNSIEFKSKKETRCAINRFHFGLHDSNVWSPVASYFICRISS